MQNSVSINEIVSCIDKLNLSPYVQGVTDKSLVGFCSLSRPRDACLTWSKQESLEEGTLPPCVVIAPAEASLDGFPGALAVIATDNPKAAFFGTLHEFWGRSVSMGIASSAVVLSKIDNDVFIGEHSYIGQDVCIGHNTVIGQNVTICCPTIIGSQCVIHPGTVIGADGFGYYFDNGVPQKVEHFGGVIIGDRVEIGANVCVDRGTIDNTEIHDDVKIDNLVHIAHNAIIGRGAMVVAGAIVCGSARLGDEAYVAPGGIVKNQVAVGAGSLIGLGAVVTKDLEDGLVAVGLPAKAIREVRDGDK